MLIYRSRVFDLYSTDLSSRRAPFEYLGHRGSCAALVVDAIDEVGLIAHHRPAIGRTLFELPTATLDATRTPKDIMIEELRSEASVRVAPSQLERLTSLYVSPGYSSELLTLFFVRLTHEQRHRSDTMRWFTFNDLNRLIHEQQVCDLKTVAAITAYQAVLWKGSRDEIL